jgi:hypothetical protein
VRWSITEGAVLQAIGRARGVRRAVRVTILAELALPLTVTVVDMWENAKPDRLMVAAAEAAIRGEALPLAPADLHYVRADLFPSERAARGTLERHKVPHSLIELPYKGMWRFAPLQTARYRRSGSRRWSTALVPLTTPRDALECALECEVAAFEINVSDRQWTEAKTEAFDGERDDWPAQSACIA